MSETDDKLDHLREHGTLNPDPKGVQDALFQGNDFFDSRDLLQVKYEMLRRVTEGSPVTRVAEEFGFSRPSFYKAQEDFQHGGLVGLIPRKRGPRGGHKLTEEVVDFLEERASGQATEPAKLVHLVKERFGIQVHPRSIVRALAKRSKKKPSAT